MLLLYYRMNGVSFADDWLLLKKLSPGLADCKTPVFSSQWQLISVGIVAHFLLKDGKVIYMLKFYE